MDHDSRGRVRVEPCPRRVRALLDGRPVLDTLHPLYVWEIPYYPAYYVPRADVVAELVDTGRTEHSPSRGEARIHDVVLGDAVAEGAARIYADSPIEALRDHVRFEWEALGPWLEEDEVVAVHPRNPYTRVDILGSSRRVQVFLDGVELADSDQPRLLFETGLPTRYYLPLSHVRTELLVPSATQTRCPYKGTASYYSVTLGDQVHEDLVWYYPAPLPESQRVIGLLCFYNEKVDLVVDGVAEDRPHTPFS